MPVFKLIDPDGNDVTTYRTTVNVWNPGDQIPWGTDDHLEVLSVTYGDEGHEFEGTLVVRQA